MLRDLLGLRQPRVSGVGQHRWGGKAGGDPVSLSASQLKRRVEDLVQETIQNYRADPEKTAAEESWDYVQFQVREAPTRWDE